jgi:hypothetical protein
MITRLARTFKVSAFGAMLAYVMLLNVLLAGFAQAAMVDHALNGAASICTDFAPSGNTGAAPDKALIQHCQMCCLAAHDDMALPPVVAAILARLGVVSAKLFPLEIAGMNLAKTQFTEARGPPLS